MLARRDDGVTIEVFADGTWRYAEAASTVPAISSDEGFRRVSWGSGRDRAIEREGREPDDANATAALWGGIDLADLRWNVAYIYLDDQLVRGKYILKTEFSNDNNFLRAFDRLSELLKKKYGIPDVDEHIWSSDLYQDEPDEWGMAVSAGHLTRFVQWVTDETKLAVVLDGENFECELVIEYVSTAHEAGENERNASTTLDDL